MIRKGAWLPTDSEPLTMRHCQHDGCDRSPDVFCLCGCDRELCGEHELAEYIARQETMARHMIAHRADRQAVHAARARRAAA